MNYLLDHPETEKLYQRILKSIPSMQNGITSTSMEQRGIHYEKNWGVSIVDLKNYATQVEKNHLLALKLWNKKWRETMILASLLDEPSEISEEQMDFWIKTSENIDIVEQIVMNLFCDTPYAFVKALEWCRGKKLLVKSAGLLMMGRLSLTSKNDIDEMFEIFFEVLPPLSKDAALSTIFYRSVCQLARHSQNMATQCVSFAESLIDSESKNAQKTGKELYTELNSEDFQSLIH
jgi:hypothetical protein